MSQIFEDLRQAKAYLATGGDACQRVADQLGRILGGETPAIALGLEADTPGSRTSLTKARLTQRDAMIVALARRHFSRLSRRQQAACIGNEIKAYQRGQLGRDIALGTGPTPDTIRGHLFRIADLPAPLPSTSTVRKILARELSIRGPLNQQMVGSTEGDIACLQGR